MEDKKETAIQMKTPADLISALWENFNFICEDSGIDPADCTGAQWNYILDRLNKIIIGPNIDILKTIYTNNTGYVGKKYNVDSLTAVYNQFYFPIVNKYNKRLSIKGYLYLTGINNSLFYDLRLKDLFSSNSTGLMKKIREDSEESLINLMGSEKSALPYITELNSRYGWSRPESTAVSEPDSETISITAAKSAFELFQNDLLVDKSGTGNGPE